MSPLARAAQPAHVNRLGTLCMRRSIASNTSGSDEIEAMLAKPSWSVKSLLETDRQPSPESTITQKQLHHLLRLSALPLPKSLEEEAKMIKTLASQLHFVKAIQSVDTSGVRPLQVVRDETAEAEKENEITMESLRDVFAKEETVPGKTRRIRRRTDMPIDTEGVEDWDALAQAPKKIGRYFVVDTGKD